MAIEKLSQPDIVVMASEPEVGMDIQIGERADGHVLVVGGRIVVQIDQGIVAQLARLNEFMRPGRPDEERYIEEWTNSLSESSPVRPVAKEIALTVLGFIHLGPIAPLPPTPSRPVFVYGHLPFHGICSGSEVFYRYEHFPTSLRIDRTTGEITKIETYAAPFLELPYVNTGLGAVARFALPSLLPARWRYELNPPVGTHMRYGASVPLYGQSGGGVEVMFPRTFKNAVPIPLPFVLPIF
jgi:hypothetical protein